MNRTWVKARSTASLIAVLLAAGCADERRIVFELSKLDENVHTVVLVFEGADGMTVETAANDGDGILIQRTVEQDRLTAIYYPESHEALGLAEGVVPTAEAGQCLTKELPSNFLRAFSRSLLDDNEPVTELAELPQAIAAFHYRVPCPCLELRVAATVPVADKGVIGAAALDEENALLVTENHLYRLHQSGTIETLPTPLGAPFTAAVRSSNGTIWLGTFAGTIVSGTLEGGFVETSSHASGKLRAIAVNRGDTPLELYTVDNNGHVGRLDESGAWTVIFNQPKASSEQIDDVTWVSSGRMIALQSDGVGPVEYEHGMAALDSWDLLLGAPSAVDAIDGVGVFLGTRLHEIYRFETFGSWRRMENPDRKLGTVRDFVPYRGGFLFGGQIERFGQYHPDAGFCFEVNIEGGGTVRHIVPLAERIVLAGDLDNVSRVLLMEPTEQ